MPIVHWAEADTAELLRRGGPGVRLIGIDRDRDALEAAKKRLAPFEGQVTYVHSNYSEIKSILSELGVAALDGCMLDLGVSSLSVGYAGARLQLYA